MWEAYEREKVILAVGKIGEVYEITENDVGSV